MSNVIDFAAALNARRNAARAKEVADATEARLQAETKALANEMGGTVGAHIVAGVMVDLKRKEQEARPLPAYCDPNNETRGSKYAATKDLDIAEVAKRIRADIKALGLAKGFKVAVRTRRYSGGQSIDVHVTAVPEGFRFYSEKMASWQKQFPHARAPISVPDQHTAEYNELKAKLAAIHGSYNRDNSDSMADYFDTRYYGSVSIDGAWDALKRETEASAGDYWAADCA